MPQHYLKAIHQQAMKTNSRVSKLKDYVVFCHGAASCEIDDLGYA
jgi:hypothetical protein